MKVVILTILLTAHCLLITVAAKAGTCPAAVAAVPMGPFPCSITATWTDNSNNELSFVVERSLNFGPFAQIGTTGPGEATYTDPTPTQSTVDNVYSYRVKATNLSGTGTVQSSGYTNVATFTIPKLVVVVPPPSAPSGLTLTFEKATGRFQVGTNKPVDFKDKRGTLELRGTGIVLTEMP